MMFCFSIQRSRTIVHNATTRSIQTVFKTRPWDSIRSVQIQKIRQSEGRLESLFDRFDKSTWICWKFIKNNHRKLRCWDAQNSSNSKNVFSDPAKRHIVRYSHSSVKTLASNVTIHTIVLVVEQTVVTNIIEILVNGRGDRSGCCFFEYFANCNESSGIHSRNIDESKLLHFFFFPQ